MPVSGRPVKAALLKITQGSSLPAVKGLQNSARGPATGREASEVAEAASARLRVESKLPSTTREAIRQASKMITAMRHCTGTAGVASAGTRDGLSGAACGSGSACRDSNVRWELPLGGFTTMGSLAP